MHSFHTYALDLTEGYFLYPLLVPLAYTGSTAAVLDMQPSSLWALAQRPFFIATEEGTCILATAEVLT